jgi:hypothetical protein
LNRAARPALKLAAALALAALLPGCAVFMMPPQAAALQRHAPADLPRRGELTATPFFAQTPYHCGPAALATALGAVGLKADPQALGDAVFLPAREGSLQLEMVAGARRQGAVATRLPPLLTALMQQVAAGQVAVVLLNLGLDFAPRWHYAVLVGYDLDAAEVVLRSGVTERERMSLRTFEHTWARSGHWAISVLPPDRLPASAAELQAQEAAVGFERAALPAQAALAYRTLLQRWPDNLVAGVGLGNTLYAAGDLAGAALALQAAATRHNSAVAWNNLAQLRLDQRDWPAAVTAAERAAARAQSAEPAWQAAALATLQEARRALAVSAQPAAEAASAPRGPS